MSTTDQLALMPETAMLCPAVLDTRFCFKSLCQTIMQGQLCRRWNKLIFLDLRVHRAAINAEYEMWQLVVAARAANLHQGYSVTRASCFSCCLLSCLQGHLYQPRWRQASSCRQTKLHMRSTAAAVCTWLALVVTRSFTKAYAAKPAS